VVTEVRSRRAELWAVWWGSQKRRKWKTLITEDHPVLTKKGWKFVRDLKAGDHLLGVWAQDTRKRLTARKQADFTCKRCGQKFNGLRAWVVHRDKCYADAQLMPSWQREKIHQMMKERNPAKDPAVMRRAMATVKHKLLTDPNYGLHRNIERFRKSLHTHPSKAQLILYEVLDELGISYEREYLWKPERLLPKTQSRYIMDAALLDTKLDIEVDGWWHFNDGRIMERDAIRDATLKENGWQILRIPGSSIHSHRERIGQLITARIQNFLMANDKEWVRILDVEPTGRVTTVYALECIPNHVYVADGILVHNCLFCQNHSISKETEVYGEDVMPEELPKWATAYECSGVGFSYNEPTIFIEYVIDAAREAHKKGKYTVFVTNGYATDEAVRAMRGYVDAVVVDYKGSGEELFQRRQTMTVSAEPVKQSLLELKEQGIHTELTDLIIPQVGENLEEAKKLCRWLYDNLGPDTPIQFTRFHPDYKLLNLPETPYEVLLRHYEVAKETGLNYAYVGNVPGNPYEHTYCPGCQGKVIERYGFMITGWNLTEKYECKTCGYKIPIEGKRASSFRYRDIEALYIPKIR